MNAHARIESAALAETNAVELTDSYKVSHWKQYPPGTRRIYSFFESRGGLFPGVTFFGLQYLLKRYLSGSVVTRENVEEAAEDFALHFGNPDIYNRAGWERILKVHDGRIPVRIRAVPEGTTVPTKNVLMTIENTDPELPWITNYVETILTHVWYPSTVATQSREMRKLINTFLEETGDPSLVDFKMHDFGFRGVSCVEQAGIGGAAHLVSFKGTDTFQGIRVARKYYNERMAGFSIPAAEHSTITSWGKENEAKAFENMLDTFPTGLVAVVSDSYDIFAACKGLWGTQLREKVLARDGTLVVRPDSGEPTDVVVKVLDLLGESFGYAVNGKGFKVLNPKIRVIQGDGIDFAMLGNVLEAMKKAGWSADNIAFGSGGGLLQKLDRDTQKFAFKCSATEIDGKWQDVMKDPVTDSGKRSKAGRLALVRENGSYRTVLESEASRLGLANELVPVFEDGRLLIDQSFADVRARALLD
ncbi:nicotinate phosphoribosyltransferase [Candidatus Kaiserbacteria bacterium RIFCSPHIGHO2_01_FULL_56_24]|uniref:Nicotinamide phosphoribosyltransferase n=1 Tax=Candidatus Kaiserbacteria bacterium RIFCSPHIGHO2_01_FULL_56_24 TaxID=1798487 RepID=A0A1F6DE94_9BACT|nr:MAG: nicotinate phosphoribosyltransferase [Candidatus Kaiserbacteria bacterium RIFCSPHIGHO2_01_FULL_56_24]